MSINKKDFLKQKNKKHCHQINVPCDLPPIPELTQKTQVCKERAVELHTPELNKNMEDCSTHVKE